MIDFSELSNKYNELEKNHSDLDSRYKDSLREIELIKSNFALDQMSKNESLEIIRLKDIINQKDNEIEDNKKQNEIDLKRLYEEKMTFKENYERLNDKLISMKSLQSEHDKLKLKVKELSQYKDRCSDLENELLKLDSKEKQIEILSTESKNLKDQVERLQKDLKGEKEKFRHLEYEKKKIEYELNDAKKDVSRFERVVQRKDTFVISNNKE